jgi:hypothetical protein
MLLLVLPFIATAAADGVAVALAVLVATVAVKAIKFLRKGI